MNPSTCSALVLLAALLCTAVADGVYEEPFKVFPAYGVPSGEFPSYHERATLAWYNMVRTAPKAYARDYLSPLMQQGDNSDSNVFSTSSLPAGPAIPWNLNLNRAARAHSADVLAHCPDRLTHDDCNGTSDSGARVAKFYTAAMAGTGEIFAPLNFDGFDAMHWPAWSIAAWVCDGTSGSSWGSDTGTQFYLNNCVGDSEAGHRQNIMTMGGEVGCGVAMSGKTLISTCDMSSQQSPYTASQTQVASGAHVTDALHKGQYYFIASATSGSSASVFVDGRKAAMKQYAGTSTFVTDPRSFASTEDCHSYYFQVGSARYPPTGLFKTFGIGSCKVDYDSGSGPTPIPTPSSGSTKTTSSVAPVPTDSQHSSAKGEAAAAVVASLLWIPLARMM